MPQKKNWKHSATRINAAEAVATKAVAAKATAEAMVAAKVTVVAKVAAKEKDAEAVEAANNLSPTLTKREEDKRKINSN
jgi:hypothetical protein